MFLVLHDTPRDALGLGYKSLPVWDLADSHFGPETLEEGGKRRSRGWLGIETCEAELCLVLCSDT